jgi:hypothetical protein
MNARKSGAQFRQDRIAATIQNKRLNHAENMAMGGVIYDRERPVSVLQAAKEARKAREANKKVGKKSRNKAKAEVDTIKAMRRFATIAMVSGTLMGGLYLVDQVFDILNNAP